MSKDVKYDKNTYIGYLIKNHKGGIKIYEGSKDESIIEKRDFILNKLESVLNKNKKLIYEDLAYYIKALEGKYIRNKICKNNSADCELATIIVKKTLKKLLKKAMKDFKELQMDILNTVKTNAPGLYKLYSNNIKKLVTKNNMTGGRFTENGISDYIQNDNFNVELFEDALSSLESMYIYNEQTCQHDSKSCNNNKYRYLFTNLVNFGRNNWKAPFNCELNVRTRQCYSISSIIQQNAPTLYNKFMISGGDWQNINNEYGNYLYNDETKETKPYKKYNVLSSEYRLNLEYKDFNYDFFRRIEEYYNDTTSNWLNPNSNVFKSILDSFVNNKILWVSEDGHEQGGDQVKDWIVNNFQYAITLPQIYLIIIALEAELIQIRREYGKVIPPDLIKLTIDIIHYFSCSSWLEGSRQNVAINFRRYAPTLTLIPLIEMEIMKLRRERTDEFCDHYGFDKSTRGGEKVYDDIFYNYYTQRGGNYMLNKLRSEIKLIKHIES